MALRRSFPAETQQAIEQAVRECESLHAGEIRFAIEQALSPLQAWQMTPRDRAIEIFSQLRVWDTEYNNGVLIFVLLADRAVEIVADRGVAGGDIDASEWQPACRLIQQAFAAGNYRQGAVDGVRAVAEVLARHPPGPRAGRNELPDAPVIFR